MQDLKNQSIKMMKSAKLLACLFFGFMANVQSQSLDLNALVIDKSITKLSKSTPLIPAELLKMDYVGDVKEQSMMIQSFDYNKAYHDQLGIFCKAENKVSKNATVNLRMRLGSLEYVDRMEGKIR